MTETTLAQKAAAVPAGYAELRRRVHETLLLGRQKIEEARVQTYWETGWWIKEHILRSKSRAGYGDEVLRKLSRDEGVSESVLDRCRKFSEKFPGLFPSPISAARQKFVPSSSPASKKGIKTQLTWTHYRTLLPLEEDKLRLRLAREAARQGWTVPELEARIKSRKKSLPDVQGPASSSPVLLTPKKGELFTYRIIEDGGALALDHGFASYWNLSRAEAKRFREGDVVRKVSGGKMEKLQKASPLLYTYEADVIRVTDGDTIWMKIYLEGRGSPPWVKEKLRLRDLDAPEIQTPEGKAAKKFVEEQIAGCSVVISTTKPDKWDRYLSDVFFIRADGSEIYLNNLLLEKGHARIKTRWSLEDWEE